MKNESGRSLVEILAALAIIGVLSVGGITGYKLATYKYQAARTIDLANKFALIVFERCNSIFEGHQTALASVENCTQNTPGIPLFENANIGNFPSFIYDKGIHFKRISLDSATNKYTVHTQLKFTTKEHCVAVKLSSNSSSGCRESSAPFSISLKTIEN